MKRSSKTKLLSGNMLGVRPRHYAERYFQAGRDKEKQKAALAGCPKEWQSLVKAHIKIRRDRP